MMRDDVSGALARALAEALSGGADTPVDMAKKRAKPQLRIELNDVSFQVGSIAIEIGEDGGRE